MTAAAITAVLGGRKVFRGKHDRIDLSEMTRAGLPVAAFAEMAARLQVDQKRLGAVVGITERTLSRRKAQGQKLTLEESDRVMRVARVFAQAEDTLSTAAKAAHWLQTPNRALGGEIPLDLLDTDAGRCDVETILGRIEYGLYS